MPMEEKDDEEREGEGEGEEAMMMSNLSLRFARSLPKDIKFQIMFLFFLSLPKLFCFAFVLVE